MDVSYRFVVECTMVLVHFAWASTSFRVPRVIVIDDDCFIQVSFLLRSTDCSWSVHSPDIQCPKSGPIHPHNSGDRSRFPNSYVGSRRGRA